MKRSSIINYPVIISLLHRVAEERIVNFFFLWVNIIPQNMIYSYLSLKERSYCCHTVRGIFSRVAGMKCSVTNTIDTWSQGSSTNIQHYGKVATPSPTSSITTYRFTITAEPYHHDIPGPNSRPPHQHLYDDVYLSTDATECQKDCLSMEAFVCLYISVSV